MRGPVISVFAASIVAWAFSVHSAALAPSADPVATFITVADSVASAEGDSGLQSFVADNSALVGASVAKLLDVAFQVAESGDATGAKENVAFAKRIAAAHEARGGSKVASGLIATSEKWTAAQRKSRARAIALEAQSVETRKAGDIPKAVALLDQARGIYEKIGDAHSIAVNWGTRGLTHSLTGDWTLALADYEKALPARRAVEDRILEGRTLNGMGTAHQQTGEYARAVEYYQQAVALREKTGDLGGLATSITYLGNAYNLSGRYVQARDCYEKALPILEAQGNPQQMVEILSGMALLNTDMGRIGDAEDAYRRGIDIAAANGLTSPEATLRRNLADNLRMQGRYSEALTNLNQAMKLVENGTDVTEQVLILSTRGTTYLNMGETESARADFVRFGELAATLDNPAYAAHAQRNFAYFYRDTGNFERGLKAAQESIVIAEKAGDGRAYSEGLHLRGNFETQLGRHEAALATWQEALAQDTNDQAGQFVLEDEVAIGGSLAALGKTKEARERLRAVGPRARAANMPSLETSALLAMGHSFEKENVDSAAFYYDRGLATIERQGAAMSAEIQADFNFGNRRHYYEEVTRFYIATFQSTHDARWSTRAFTTIEKAKARGLLDMLQATVADRSSPAEEELLDRLYSLDPKSADYVSQRAEIERSYVAARAARLKSALGGLSTDAAVADPQAIARLLPNKTVFLEYALGDSASFLWVVNRDGHQIVTLPPRKTIEPQVRRLRDALSRADGANDALLSAARGVYQLLIAPAATHIGKAEVAIIVPDGALFELPFEVLLTADPAKGSWSQQPFWMRRVTTLYAPSATIYASLRAETNATEFARDILAVGAPAYSTLAPNGEPPLAPLPFSAEEVAAVTKRVKDDRKVVLTGPDALEASVKRELRGDTPRVVHLATHGLVDATEPERSSVVFAAGEGDDGYFHTLEILATPVGSRLVVMSACESARGKVSRGEGVIGLSRAFLASGAGSVVASLWAVSDESTAELMTAFYERMLGKKRSASRALNEARLALLESDAYSHPFYWSPFVVTGTELSPW